MQKESQEEATFRKQMETVQSVLSRARSAKLPEGTDYHYYKTFDAFKNPVEALQKQLSNTIMHFPGAGRLGGREALQDPDDTLNLVVNLLDEALGRVDKTVDEGIVALKKLKSANNEPLQEAIALPSTAGEVAGTAVNEKAKRREQILAVNQSALTNSAKPQNAFMDDIDNSNSVFKGKLKHWQEYVQDPASAPERLKPILHKFVFLQNGTVPPHPLAPLIQDMVYPDFQLEASDPIKYKGLDNTVLTYVDTEEALLEMASKLDAAKELAVDLEHHSFRSFLGLTCLMQISDRNEDFIVDVIKLRKHIGPVLAPIFADPQVVKVMHGADWDIFWLQRDFGIYVANLFDTGQALRVLNYERLGLGNMLEKLCGEQTDKRYQLADWRTRPLPKEMMKYARMDTHYLLYMYDRLKVQLAEAGDTVAEGRAVLIPSGKPGGALGTVLERSRQLSLKRYENLRFSEVDWRDALQAYRSGPLLSYQQEAVFAGLYKWRDATARARDDSLDFVVSKRQLLMIAKSLPRSAKELKRAVSGDNTPSLVLAASDEILEVVAQYMAEANARLAEGLQQGPAAPPAVPVPPNPAKPQETTPVVASPVQEPALQAASWEGPQLHIGLRPQGPTPSEITGDGAVHAPEQASQQDMIAQAFDSHNVALSGAHIASNEAPTTDRQAIQAIHLAPRSVGPLSVKGLAQLSVKPIQMAQTQRGSLRGMLGSRMATAVAPLLEPNAGQTATSAGLGTPPDQDSEAMRRVQEVRSQFAMPMPVMAPPTAAEEISSATRISETRISEGTTDAAEPTSGRDIRETVDALHSENNSQHTTMQTSEQAPQFKTSSDALLGDFLPLPISQRYPKYSKRKLEEVAQPQKPLSSDSSSASEGDKGSEADSADDHINAIMKATGLKSESDEDSRPQKKQRKRKLKSTEAVGAPDVYSGPYAVVEDRVGLQPGDSPSPQQPDHESHDTVEVTHPGRKKTKKAGKAGNEGGAFDFEAAKVAAPGLALDLDAAPAGLLRGGRGGKGMRGRGRAAGKPHGRQLDEDSYRIYQLDEGKFMRGGKKSASMPRSGNRNVTFGS